MPFPRSSFGETGSEGEPNRNKTVDSATLFRYITGTLKNSESGRGAWAGARVLPARLASGGTGMAQSRKDGVRQLALTRRKGGWTRRQIEAFFEHLAATCNVAASAAAGPIKVVL